MTDNPPQVYDVHHLRWALADRTWARGRLSKRFVRGQGGKAPGHAFSPPVAIVGQVVPVRLGDHQELLCRWSWSVPPPQCRGTQPHPLRQSEGEQSGLLQPDPRDLTPRW
ncbi:hypothetical protein [Streptomyces sp. NPDC007883]|uniref:hypothetical protein n=1 Tax=Streptomyces sp. NPDC007883 TaxID=3155116 RepID=UPI00340EFE93